MSESHSNNRYAFGGNGAFTQGGSGKLPPLAKKPVAIKGRQSQGVNQEGTEPDHEASTFR